MKTTCSVCHKQVRVNTETFTIVDHGDPECPASRTKYESHCPTPKDGSRQKTRKAIFALRRRKHTLEQRLTKITGPALDRDKAEVAAIDFALRCISLCITNCYISTNLGGLAAITEETDS